MKRKIILLCLLWKYSDVVSEVNKIYNLMVLNEETNTNMEDYWESGYSDIDPNGDKHLSSVYDVIAHGNFRSALVDDWFLEPPHEVALLLFNGVGDLHFWMIFNTVNSSDVFQSWMTPERLLATSSPVISSSHTSIKWNIPGYQFVMCPLLPTPTGWFAVTDRNIRNNSNSLRPYFVIPMNASDSFTALSENQNAGPYQTVLIKSFQYSGVKTVEIDLVLHFGPGPVYISEIEVTNIATTIYSAREDFTLEYSIDDCSLQKRVEYSNLTDRNVTIFKTSVINRIETVLVRCLWITFERKMWSLTVNIYAPSPEVTALIVLIRGFWYTDYLLSGTSQAVNNLLKTLGDTTGASATESDIATLTTVEFTTATEEKNTQNNQHTTSVATTENTSPEVSSGLASLEETTHSLLNGNLVTSSSSLVCLCSCVAGINIDLETRLKELKLAIAVNKTALSSYRRRLISADDNSQTASYLGYFAGTILSLVLLFILLLDMSSFAKHIKCIQRRSKRMK
ncbi:coxA [Mytilus edulis]|uniref:CoxA n=1 Tax=Mytilus edulis TaxID=6550 RepID=A0A8S3T3P9_MYTED|nr:coxA [Mytilus edulis]